MNTPENISQAWDTLDARPIPTDRATILLVLPRELLFGLQQMADKHEQESVESMILNDLHQKAQDHPLTSEQFAFIADDARLAEQSQIYYTGDVDLFRLASQLKVAPADLFFGILLAGFEAIDDALASESPPDFKTEPPLFVAIDPGYSRDRKLTITGLIDQMGPKRLADCQKEADECGQTLQAIIRERISRNTNLALLEGDALKGGAL